MWPFSKKEEVPSDWDLQQAFDLAPFTPDIAVIQQKRSQILFVCDELQKHHPGFELIKEHSASLGGAFTKDQFVMYKRKLGLESYAVALDNPFFQAQKGIIRGELYAVLPMRYIELDTHYQNGVVFERRRVTVKIPHLHIGKRKDGSGFRIKKTSELRCFMYVGVPDYWNKVMDEEDGFFLFDNVRRFTPANPDLTPYYYFSKLEYEDN